MKNPLDLSIDQLCALSPQALDRILRQGAGGLTRSRLIIGRGLIAMDATDAHDAFGCHSSTHYAISVMRLTERQARDLRRVARRLLDLPRLTEATEAGTIAWSALRSILPICNPSNEAEWLHKAQTLTARDLERAVRYEQVGNWDTERPRTVEITFLVSEETEALFRLAVRDLCEHARQRLNGEECLEALCAERLAGTSFPDEVTLARLRREALRDAEAEAARTRAVGEADPAHQADSADYPAAMENTSPALPLEVAAVEPGVTHVGHAFPSLLRPIDDLWQAVATRETACPGSPDLTLVRPAASWHNQRLRWNPDARLVTDAQRREILRRDTYQCATPGCPHTLYLHVHHIVWYCEGGLTIPDNLVTVCSACHRALHEGQLNLTGDDPRGLKFTDAAGRNLAVFRGQPTADWVRAWFARPAEFFRSGCAA